MKEYGEDEAKTDALKNKQAKNNPPKNQETEDEKEERKLGRGRRKCVSKQK